jgi:hypothetical protein
MNLRFVNSDCRFLSIPNPKSEIPNRIGGLKGIQTLTRSLQDFYAVELHHQPEMKLVSKAGFSPARVSFSQSRIRFARLFLFPPLRREKINTDGEI